MLVLIGIDHHHRGLRCCRFNPLLVIMTSALVTGLAAGLDRRDHRRLRQGVQRQPLSSRSSGSSCR